MTSVRAVSTWPAHNLRSGETSGGHGNGPQIISGRGSMEQSQWFERAANSVRATRSTDNPLNLKVRQGRLELSRNFFSARVMSSWNDIPNSIRETTKSENFQKKYKQLREHPDEQAC
jgi:hypothetical protein